MGRVCGLFLMAGVLVAWTGMISVGLAMHNREPFSSIPLQERPQPKSRVPSGFGSNVVCVGDLDGDRFDDLAVAAPGAFNGLPHGRVFIISSAAGELIRELSGIPGDLLFGRSLDAIRLIPGDAYKLGVSSLKSGTAIIDLNDGSRVTTLTDVAYIVGTPGDVDGDHFDDILCGLYAIDTLRWHSGRDWSEGRQLQVKDGRLLAADFDGDGVRDIVGQAEANQRVRVLYSSGSGKQLSRFVTPEPDVSFISKGAACIGPVGLDKPIVVLPAMHDVRKTTYFLAYSPVGEELAAMIAFGSGREGPDEGRFRVFDVGDLDGDAERDFVAMQTSFFTEEIRAYSGRKMDLIWRQKGIVRPGTETLDLIKARGADGKSMTLIAVGRVHTADGGRFDRDGEVVLLDSRDGTLIRTLHEKDYVH